MAIDFITKQLAVGALEDAQSQQTLREARIDFVLSLAAGAKAPGVRQAYLAVTDQLPLPPRVIECAVRLIAAEVAAGRRVLVHCHMGISRSPAIAICFLRHEYAMPIAQALIEVVRARPQARPHPALLASIDEHFAWKPLANRVVSLAASPSAGLLTEVQLK